jgi:hypothetical protein
MMPGGMSDLTIPEFDPHECVYAEWRGRKVCELCGEEAK